MSFLGHLPHWLLSVILLTVLAIPLRFSAMGYGYIAYTLLFIAALITIHRFAPAALWRACVIATMLGLMYFCVVEALIIGGSRTDPDPERKYLIVLGAEVRGDRPSLTMLHRLEAALEYLEQYPESVAIVSGGQGRGEHISEAQAMADWLETHGIDKDRILRETQATSTSENLGYSFAIIRRRGDEPDGNVAVLSSSYHLYRAKTMCRMQGVEAVGVAGRFGYPVVMLNFYIREAFGVTRLWVLGH